MGILPLDHRQDARATSKSAAADPSLAHLNAYPPGIAVSTVRANPLQSGSWQLNPHFQKLKMSKFGRSLKLRAGSRVYSSTMSAGSGYREKSRIFASRLRDTPTSR